MIRAGMRVWAVAGAAAGLVAATAPARSAEFVNFVPHRAIYDIKLDGTAAGSNVAEMNGRMVYELTGSVCEGYTQNMRFITDMTNQDGSVQISDLRNSSWEEVSGKRLRFNTSQYQNDKLAEHSQGDAARKGALEPVNVALMKPARREIVLPANVYFPIQHSMALVEAARAGTKVFAADLYDGSERGDKVYATTSIIGVKVAPGRVPSKAAGAERLNAVAYWPVAIGYFEREAAKGDAVPTYELSFNFFENGVSDSLRIDYGDFAIRGDLKEVSFLPETNCAAGKH